MVMLVGCGAGLGALFSAYGPLQYALKIVGAAYMLWLAWKVANARPADDELDRSARPLTFLQAAASPASRRWSSEPKIRAGAWNQSL